MLAVLQDAIWCFQNFLFATDKRRKEMLNEAEEWFNERGNEWIFSFENICDALGVDPQYLRQRLMSWKRRRLAARATVTEDRNRCRIQKASRRPLAGLLNTEKVAG